MPVELAGITLPHLTHIATSEGTRIVRHPVPGSKGDLAQSLGRPSMECELHGIFYGDDAPAELDKLRGAHTATDPVDFFIHAADASDKVQTLHFTRVLITDLRVEQHADAPSEFGFACRVVEYIKPPPPAAASPAAGLDGGLADEAAAAVDGVQDALAEVSGLVGILGENPSFANPVEKLSGALKPFEEVAGKGAGVIGDLLKAASPPTALPAPGSPPADPGSPPADPGSPPADPGSPPAAAGPSPLLTPAPTTTAVTAARDQAMTAVGAAKSSAAALASDPKEPRSPLNAVHASLDGVDGAVGKVGVKGLSEELPAAIDRMHNAIPPSALEAVEGVQKSYDTARGLLQGGPLSQLKFGRKLLNVTDEIVGTFEQELEKLAQEIFDPQTLALIKEGLADLEALASGAGSKDLVAFLSRNLTGVAHDLLAELNSEILKALAVLAPIAADTLATVARLEQAAADAVKALETALTALRNAGAAAQAQAVRDLLALIDDIERTARALMAELAGRFDQVATAVGGLDWKKVMAEYASLLEAIDIGQVPTIDDAVAALTTILDGLSARVSVVGQADELGGQVDVLVQAIDDTVATAGVRAARDAIHDAFMEIQGAIASIPTEDVQKGIDSMLGTVKDELQSLNLAEVTKTINDDLSAVAGHVSDATKDLAKTVSDGVAQLVAGLDQIPLESVSKEIVDAIAQAKALIDEIAGAVESHIDEVKALLAEFDAVSFTPIADEVIGEIDDLRARLEKIDPSALSAPERFAISAALTVLEAIDLEGTIITELEAGFDVLRRPVDDAIDVVVRPLEALGNFIGELDPAKLVGPVDDLLSGVEKQVDSIDAEVLFKPLRARLDELVARVGALNPGALLGPIEGPYNALVGSVGRLDPAKWVAPLKDLYAEIDKVIGDIDITPLFDELEQARRGLLEQARKAVVDGLRSSGLPAPVTALAAEVASTLEKIAVAAFEDPHQLKGAVSASLDLTTPLMILDVPFDELLKAVNAVPAADLVPAANTLREGFGPGLDALDPRSLVAELRARHARLASLDPTARLGAHTTLPGLRGQLDAAAKLAPPALAGDIAAVGTRLDAVIGILSTELVQGDLAKLIAAYHRVSAAVGASIDALDPAVATGPYLHLRGDIQRIVPAFLRQPAPLTQAAIIDGLKALRPSNRAPTLKVSLDAFIARAAPLEARVAAGFDQLLAALRRALSLVDPVVFKADVAAIYATVRAKVRIIDPEALAKSTSGVLNAALDQLKAIDPKQVADGLNGAYHQAFDAVSKDVGGVLDTIAAAVDAEVARVRDAVKRVITEFHQAIDGAVAGVGDLGKDLQGLILADIVDRLKHFTDNLAQSLRTELERVRKAFDAMLDAIPLEKGSKRAAA